MLLIPSKTQWRKWSLPSKLTCIGAYLGALSIVLGILFFAWPPASSANKAGRSDTELQSRRSVSNLPATPAQSRTPSNPYELPRTNDSLAALAETGRQGTLPPKKLSPCSLRVVPNITTTNVEAAIQSIQNDLKLRPLAPVETGKPISQTPVGTFSFVSAYALKTLEDGSMYGISNTGVSRRWYRNREFELLKATPESILVIAFAGSAEGADAAILDGRTPRRITLFPSPSSEASSLLVVPLDRMLKSSVRFIDAESGEMVSVLDVVLW